MPDTNTTRRPGDVTFHAAVCVGIGDDDTADALAESEHESWAEAQTWAETELAHAEFTPMSHRCCNDGVG
jgi:hypothetical protein